MDLLRKIAAIFPLVLLASSGEAQIPLDSAQLKNVKGAILSFSSLTKKVPLTLVCFWSMNSESSINELNAINGHYEKWKQATPFTLLAVSVDETVPVGRLRGIAHMNSWAFDVYADFKGDLHDALNVGPLPLVMLLRGGLVIYQQSGFEPGTENYLFSKIQAISPAAGEKK
jgi:hypothetical protein